MSDGNNDELDKIMNDIGYDTIQSDEKEDESRMVDNKRNLSEQELEELSKEDIANKFDMRFARSSAGSKQHLLPPDENDTHCSVSITDNFRISEKAGPFDPICLNCKSNAFGSRGTGSTVTPESTKFELRQWLADEIDDLREPEETTSRTSPNPLTKSELNAIVLHIQSLKQNG